MSWILRGRVTAYDNIAAGSATGRERVKGTNTTEPLTRDNVGSGTSEHTSGPMENRFSGQTSYATSLGRPNQERLGTT